MKKNIISQKRVKYICPCCKEIDTILFCCECLRKQKEKTIKQAREEIIKEIKKDIVVHKDCRFYHQYRNKQLSCLDIVLLDINRKLRQLDKEGK